MLIVRIVANLVEFVARVTWPVIGLFFVVLYTMGAVVLQLAEPEGNGFLSLANYSWWFLVTITTVGYGDISPQSGPGRLVAGAIMIFGIGTIGVVLGKLGEAFFEIGRKRMLGQSRLRVEDHLVILGYNSGETQLMVEEIIADADWAEREIVLCSAEQEQNPIPERVKFVRGVLSSDDVMSRACVAKAKVIIIQSHVDSTTIVTAIAVNSVNPTAHIVANVVDAESEKHIRRISSRIECVRSMQIPMTVQALQDPGITRVMQGLLSNLDDDVFFRLDVPNLGEGRDWSFAQLLKIFKREYEAILVGVSSLEAEADLLQINPPSDYRVREGMTLYYIANKRLAGLDWSSLVEGGEGVEG